MPVYRVTSEITINKPAFVIFDSLTTVMNHTNFQPSPPMSHPTKLRVGHRLDEMMNGPPRIEGPVCTPSFYIQWEVRKIIKDTYFELTFPQDFESGPLNQLIITYDLIPLGEHKTHLIRNNVSFVKPLAVTSEYATQTFRDPEVHVQYLQNLKAQLEGRG